MGIFTQNHKGIYFKTSSSSIQYTNGGSEVMTFLSSGNVGIGTTSPGSKLVVSGSFRAGNNGYDSTPGGTAFSHTLSANSGSTRVVNFDGNGSNPSVWWNNANTRLGAIDGETEGLAFWTNNAAGNWNKNFYIQPTQTIFTQNVGIGMTAPLQPLSIENSSSPLIKIRNTTNGSGAAIEFNDNGTSAANQNGRISYYHSDSASQGGGSSFWLTGEDDQTLVLANNGRVVVQKSGSASEVGYGFYDDVNTGMYRVSADALGFATGGTRRLDMNSSGVRIGTGSRVTTILDQDDMSSNSATALATQQSIKTYVDNEIAGVPQGDITAVVAGTGLTGGGTSGSVTLNVAGGTYTPYNDIRSLGVEAFTNGTDPNITTAQVMDEIDSDGGFDSYSSVFKTSWSYAGNYNLTDAGRFTETAGSSWITWTDNSSDSTRGNITTLAIAPNTGGSAGGVFIYNNQGGSYSPGWREVWTSTSDGAGSGLDADLLDGQQGSYYATAGSLGSYLLNTTDTFTGALTIVGDIRGNGQQLVLNAGEAYNSATGQTNEYVYINAEQGLEVNSSPDNWASGWAGRNTTTIGKADGTSSFSGKISVQGSNVIEIDQTYSYLNHLKLLSTFGSKLFSATNYGYVLESSSTPADPVTFRFDNDRYRIYSGSSGEALTVLANTNVGIGTTSPVGRLEVVTTDANRYIRFKAPNGEERFQFYTGGTGNPAGQYMYDANGTTRNVQISAGGTSYFNGGNIGIGTTSPGAKLDVTGSYGDVIKAVSGSQNITTNFVAPTTGSGLNNITSTAGKFNIGTTDAQPFDLVTSSISRISIISTGKVGINNTNPTYQLHVSGNAGFSGQTTHSSGLLTNSTQSRNKISVWSSLSSYTIGMKNGFGYGGLGGDGTGTEYAMSFQMSNTTNRGWWWGDTSHSDVQGSMSLTTDGELVVAKSLSVGAGETTRTAADRPLEVTGNALIDGRLTIEGPAPMATSPMLELHRTSPVVDYKDLNSAGYFSLKERFLNSGSTVIGSREVSQNPGGSGIYHNFDNGASGGSQFHQKQNSFHWKINSTSEKLTLGTNGYIGINDTSPSYQLDVNGSGRFTSTVTATNFILSSDERLKENVKKVCDNRVKADWKTFELKTDKGQKRYGVIAQELEKTNPEFVREDSQGFKSVAYIDLLIAKIAELEARLEKLEK